MSNRVKAGIYRFRIVASGGTLRGVPFTREQLASAAVWAGGDQPYQPPRDDDQSDWCSLLTCLLSEKSLSRESEERLREEGLNRCASRCGAQRTSVSVAPPAG